MSESNLQDRATIHDLFTRYCCALDNGEVEAAVDCFTVDAILKSPVIDISGRDEICAFAGRFGATRRGHAISSYGQQHRREDHRKTGGRQCLSARAHLERTATTVAFHPAATRAS
jgi:SnoaL-like domain